MTAGIHSISPAMTPQGALLVIAQFGIAVLLLHGIRLAAKHFRVNDIVFIFIDVMRVIVFGVGILGVLDVSIGLSGLFVWK